MPKEKGVIHIPIVLILVVVVSITTAILVSQKNSPDVKGTLIAKDDNGDSGGSSGSGSSGSGSSGSGSGGTSSTSSTKTTTPEGVRIKTETKEDKQKTEIKFGEGEKIKTEIEEGRTRIDVYSGGVKVRYEIRDGRVIVKAATDAGEDIEDQELFKIVDRIDKSGIKIATEGGRLIVVRNQVGASSNFPLQVDLNTNQLIVTTPAGQKVVTVLPDRAVQNMLAANVISRLGPPTIRQAVEGGETTTAAQIIQLGLRAGVPVYEIPGIRDFRLLGFIPVSAPATAIVSAETGELLATEQPLLSRIVDLLSP